MGFLDFYGLNDEPFRLTPDPAYFFPSRIHQNGLFSLDCCAERGEGFCVVAGEPGTGKTTLLNVFMERWREKAEIAVILTPRLSPEDFLQAVLEDLGVRCPGANKNELLRVFRDLLVEKSSGGRSVIIVVDEAQNLPDETLEELRLLSNLEAGDRKLLHIMLVGQPELLRRLRSPALRQLDQRIVTRVHLRPFCTEEIRDYIGFRLMKAGRGHVQFEGSAIKAIRAFSGGIPRLINTITTRVLMSAYLDEADTVRRQHVRYALKSLRGVERKRPLALGAAAAALALAVAFYWAFQPAPGPSADLASAGGVTRGAVAADAGEPGARTAVVTAQAANIRERPGVSSRRVSVVYSGEKIRLTGETSRQDGTPWYRVETGNGGGGWMSSGLFRIIGDA
ncbi:MAG: hypothetical protein Kow0025_18270 [Thermodesulfovibrionales bacterium]